MNFQECDLGFTAHTDKALYFFGKVQATREEIEKKFPQITFLRVKQTHSDIVREASTELYEADAHWTQQKNRGLLIATADCTPVLILNKTDNTVAAIHAGWRGVENQIVFKTLQVLKASNQNVDQFEIAIGPHILQKSFEVKKDVLDLLLQSSFESDKLQHFIQVQDRYLVDLEGILRSQIKKSFRGSLPALTSLARDTKTSLDLHSFRRDKENSGRNLSFVSLI